MSSDDKTDDKKTGSEKQEETVSRLTPEERTRILKDREKHKRMSKAILKGKRAIHPWVWDTVEGPVITEMANLPERVICDLYEKEETDAGDKLSGLTQIRISRRICAESINRANQMNKDPERWTHEEIGELSKRPDEPVNAADFVLRNSGWLIREEDLQRFRAKRNV